MKRPTHTCDACGAATGDGITLCEDDATALLTELRAAPGIIEDLHTTMSRQDVMGDGSGGRPSTETPLVFREDAAEALRQLSRTLVGLVRSAAASLGLTRLPEVPATVDPHDPARMPPDVSTATLAVRILAEHIDTVRTMTHAGELLRRVTSAMADARTIVDRRVVRLYLGPCGAELADEGLCEALLYARVESARDEIVCPWCETIWGIAERRAWLLAAAGEHAGTASEVASLLRTYGLEIGTSTVRQWAREGRIEPDTHNDRGWPLYSISNVYLYAITPPSERPKVKKAPQVA